MACFKNTFSFLRSRLPTLLSSFIAKSHLWPPAHHPQTSPPLQPLFSTPLQLISRPHQGLQALETTHSLQAEKCWKPVSYIWHWVLQVSSNTVNIFQNFSQSAAWCWNLRCRRSNLHFASWLALTFKVMGTKLWDTLRSAFVQSKTGVTTTAESPRQTAVPPLNGSSALRSSQENSKGGIGEYNDVFLNWKWQPVFSGGIRR